MKSHQQDHNSFSAKSFSDQLQSQWQHGGFLSTCLLPFSKVNGLIQNIRKKLYQRNIKPSYRAPCPVFVVGNIYVGGTAETPVVAALIKAFQSRGYQPGIISRGYGVKIGKEARVAKGPEAQATLIGDEPALLAQYAAIAVHPKRKLAVQALLTHYPQTDVIISDDGLQHLALQRDVEIVVQDERGIGNGLLLPAGPLRESADKLAEVDVIITNRNHQDFDENKQHNSMQIPLRCEMRLQASALVQIQNNKEIAIKQWCLERQNQSIAAVAGIGNPQRFFDSLADLGIHPQQQKAFADHHAFTAEDFSELNQDIILMTEKDALKCRHLADERFYFLKVNAELSDTHFFDKIEQLIKNWLILILLSVINVGKSMHELISTNLVCPISKAPLRLSEDRNYLICEQNGKAYPIENGLPILLPVHAIASATFETK